MALTQQGGRDQVPPLSLPRTGMGLLERFCVEFTKTTHPLLFDHIFDLLHGSVSAVTSKVKKNTEGSDLSASLGKTKQSY
jgi:hypothetical protein